MYLDNEKVTVDKSLDTVIVQKVVTDIAGGVVLDVADYDGDYIYAGQPIYAVDKDGKTNYVTLNVTKAPADGEKGELAEAPEGAKLLGFSIQTEKVERPHVGVMTFGVLNNEAAYFDVSEQVKELAIREPIK